LQAIHLFSEELKQLVGGISLYNESLDRRATCTNTID